MKPALCTCVLSSSDTIDVAIKGGSGMVVDGSGVAVDRSGVPVDG